jgi:starch synthase
LSLRIGFVAAESVPFVKVGGLGDVAGALPRELERAGARVVLVLPAYRDIDRSRFGIERVALPGAPTVPVGTRREPWWLERATLPGSQVPVLFVGGRYFDRTGTYTDPRSGRDFEDAAERWIFFARAALAALESHGERLDVLHLNDHHTALAAAYVRHPVPPAFFGATATYFSIHNLGYQGVYAGDRFGLTGLPASFMAPMGAFEFYGAMNLMKGGLVLADRLGTVSPTYAQEIQESEDAGRGLQGVLRSRRHDLDGILNGIDTDVWDPSRDPHLATAFDRDHLEGKEACRRALRARLGLPDDPQRPLFGSIGRLVGQKGIDIMLRALPDLLSSGLQLAVLGSGQADFEQALVDLARRYPRQLSVTLEFDDVLAHGIEAGSDFFLMPSRYEPCGLNQMYSLRYGTVPIVRRTGGLADTVQEWSARDGTGNGFLFGAYEPVALVAAVRRALAAYADPATMQRLRRNGMAADFSWRRSAAGYLDAYRAAIAARGAAARPA